MADLAARYDPMTKQVRAKSRLIYLHEYRHSRQPQLLILLYSYWLVASGVFFAVICWWTGNLWLIGISLPPVALIVALEIDAWVYALRKCGQA